MLDWLIPISLFWTLIAVYIGGCPVHVEGGSGTRQVLGLVGTFALYLVVWGLLHAVLGGTGLVTRVAVPTVVCVLALPLFTAVGFRVMGVRVRLHRGAGTGD